MDTRDHVTLLSDLWEELGRGKIVEAPLRAKDYHVAGLTVFPDYVYVNPAPAIVETLLHELLHRRWPSWSEARVHRTARALLGSLNDAELAKWYRAYEAAKRRRKKPVQAD